MTKMTYVSAINDVINGVALTDEHIEKLTALKASLEKRASGKRSMTATQKANVGIKEAIVEVLSDGTAKTATEIGKALDLSNQKVSSLLSQMIEAGTVVKTVEKRKSFFSLAE